MKYIDWEGSYVDASTALKWEFGSATNEALTISTISFHCVIEDNNFYGTSKKSLLCFPI